MLNIKGILSAVLKDVQQLSDNILIVDDQHIIDKLSGVEFHLYDDYFQMTRGDDKPISVGSFSKDEQVIIMGIKDAITDPSVTLDKKENYAKYLTENRERLSSWYENPEPVVEGVQEEENTEEYIR